MATISGKQGKVSFLGQTLKITKWTLEINCDIINVTDSGCSGWKAFIPNGRNTWKGTFECLVETGNTGLSVSTFFAATISLESASNHMWNGNAYIIRKNASLEVAGSEPTRVQYEFQGTGLLSIYVDDMGGFEMDVS